MYRYMNCYGDLVVTSPRELIEISRTLVKFSLSFLEEDLCLVHEFSWWSLGRNAVGQANDVECCGERLADSGPRGPVKIRATSGGDWRNCNWSGWWPLQHLRPGHYSNAVLRVFGERQRGELMVWGRAQWIPGVGLLECSLFRLVNDENEEGAQWPDIPVLVSHRSSDLSSISCSLELLRVAHNNGEFCVFVLTFFLFKSGSSEHDLKMIPLTTVT